MTRRIPHFAVAAVLAAGLGVIASAQQQQPPAPTPDQPVFRSSTRLIVTTVSVKDKDGRPVEGLTAKDFVESWKRTLSPETAASYNYQLFYLKNAQPFAEGKITNFSEVGVKALDDQTLEVTLENPTPFFLDLCATPPLQPVPVERIIEF